jgi:integrase
MAKTRRKGSHATGTLVPPASRGKSWAIRWQEDGERKYAGGYENKDAAQSALDVVNGRVTAGLPGVISKPVEVKPGDLIRDAAEDWLDSRKGTKSYRDARNRYDKHLAPLLGHRHLDRVTKSTVDELVTHLRTTTKLSPASIERVIYTLSAFYRWAIRRELVTSNPVQSYLASLERTERAALKTQHDPATTPFYDRSQVTKLFKALVEAKTDQDEPVEIAYALSALAGLRPGEVMGLEWLDVDLEAATITVRRRVRNGSANTPKSGKAREVPMVPSLVAILKARHDRHPEDVLVVPPDARLVNMERGDGKLVRFVGPASIQAALDKAAESAKLPRLTFYQGGRHSFASNWVIAGLDIYRLSKILGHSSVETTQAYAHLAKKAPDAVLELADIKLAA